MCSCLRRTRPLLVLVALVLAGCEAASRPAATDQAFTFTDVAAEAGFGDFRHENGSEGKFWYPEMMGAGGGFVDYDGDGWEDVVLVGGGRLSPTGRADVEALRLYRNNRDGTFTEVTAAVGLAGVRAYGTGVAVADYDNDGDQDIYLTTLGENLLFRNDGGTFTEVGREAGVTGGSEWSTSALFFDADRDGHVDLYVGNYVKWSPENDLICVLEGGIRSYCTPELYTGTPSHFFRNNGDGTFSDWTERAGFLPAPGKTLGVAEYDVNGDGWSDLLVANDTQPDLYYVNNGDGTFTEQGALSGMAYDENGKARAGMGIDVGVVDETGQATLFVGNFSKEMISVFRYLGNGLFVDRAAISQIGHSSLLSLTFGLLLFDVDLDGDLDLYVANGHVQPEIEQTQEGATYAQTPHLYLNRGDGTFVDVAPEIAGPLQRSMVARGVAYADYDRDGDLDLLVTENAGPAHLLRNDAPTGNVLRVRLQGRASNRDGLSARVVVRVGDHRQERFVRTGSSFLSVSEKAVTFGLGEAERADSLVVYWPSGQVDRHAGLEAGAEVHVTEGAAVPAVRPLGSGGRLARLDAQNR